MAEACVTSRLPARGKAFLYCLWDTIDNYLDTIFVYDTKRWMLVADFCPYVEATDSHASFFLNNFWGRKVFLRDSAQGNVTTVKLQRNFDWIGWPGVRSRVRAAGARCLPVPSWSLRLVAGTSSASFFQGSSHSTKPAAGYGCVWTLSDVRFNSQGVLGGARSDEPCGSAPIWDWTDNGVCVGVDPTVCMHCSILSLWYQNIYSCYWDCN